MEVFVYIDGIEQFEALCLIVQLTLLHITVVLDELNHIFNRHGLWCLVAQDELLDCLRPFIEQGGVHQAEGEFKTRSRVDFFFWKLGCLIQGFLLLVRRSTLLRLKAVLI